MLLRFVCLAIIPPPITACVACRPVTICPPLGGWRMVFLVLGSSNAPRAIGSVLVRGPPERNASVVSFADAPRFARNALRPIGQNGFDAHAPNANLGRTGDAGPVAVQSAALVPYRGKEVPVRWAHTHMKTKQGSMWRLPGQVGSLAFGTEV